jgi:hypothetical protein
MKQSTPYRPQRSALEEKYFRQKEAELLARLQAARQQAEELSGLAQETGIANEDVLAVLHDLGYTRDTVRLLHLVPLAQVAWASGSVTLREREMVLRLCEWRGVEKGSPAWKQLNDWLDKRPSDEFFLTTLRIIRRLLDFQSENEGVVGRTDLISFCIRIAMTSGGFLGVTSKISEGEQMALDQIVEELTRRNPEAVRRVVEGK